MHSNLEQNFNKQSGKYKPLILIIDNDQDNLLLASYIIESMGLNYIVTDHSEGCLDLVKKVLPDLILLDIVMPKMSGLEIVTLLKQDKKLSSIITVAVTGLTRTDDKNKLIVAGFDDYLSKPYLIEDLEAMLSRLLKNQN